MTVRTPLAHDAYALNLQLPETAAIYVMDRSYVDFEPLSSLSQNH